MWFRKIFFELLAVVLALFGIVCGGLCLLVLTVLLWQVSWLAAGALLGGASLLCFALARATVRGALLPADTENARHLSGANALVPTAGSEFERRFGRR